MTTTTINDASTDATSNIADLLPRAGDGDPRAWEEILRRYSALVSATVRLFRLQDADTLDAVQTTWLRLAENAHRIRHPDRLGAWLATTSRRECLRILRHITPIPHLSKTVEEAATEPSTGPEHIAIEADETRWLWKHVDGLPPRRRTLLRALFTDNPQSYAKIATITGIHPAELDPHETEHSSNYEKHLANTNRKEFGNNHRVVEDVVVGQLRWSLAEHSSWPPERGERRWRSTSAVDGARRRGLPRRPGTAGDR
jgi:RNA polymerase sigma factor (sigma-70 family)